MAEKTGDKVDAVFERVQEILEMRKNMQKVVVNIYHDGGGLDTAFFTGLPAAPPDSSLVRVLEQYTIHKF